MKTRPWTAPRLVVSTFLAATSLLWATGVADGQGTLSRDAGAAELAALQKRHDASELRYAPRYRAFQEEYLALAKKFRGSEPALTAELWLLRNAWWLREAGTGTSTDPGKSTVGKSTMGESTARSVVDRILDTYPHSPRLAKIADYRYSLGKADQAAVFARVESVTPHDSVKAAILLARAKTDKSAENKKALFEELAQRYGHLPWRTSTYATIAHASLNPHSAEDLAMGQVAPEIRGKDIHGVEFKLSDYRGKVVLLDFWGDW